jgi:hypothetical protein
MASARLLAALTVLLLLTGVGRAQVPDDIKIGAIRWDAWFDGAPDAKVLEQPEWRHRAPWFARWDENGRIILDGDKEYVLQAEVAYARAIGLNYFIFGYYPETGSWGRDPVFHKKLNGALRAYLALPDRQGVKFALSLNQLFPMSDVPVMAEAIAQFVAHPDYVRTETGTAPVFVLAHDGFDWSKFFGSDDKAREAIRRIRDAARAASGRELTLVIMHYTSDKAWEVAQKYGLDMVTTYSNFAPGKGPVEQTDDACILHGEAVWYRAANANVPYAPNVTLGWDNRPRKTPAVNTKNSPQGPWCVFPTEGAIKGHFARAAAFVRGQTVPVPFKTITVYAWNEFAEGIAMSPTVGDKDELQVMLKQVLGRRALVP